MNLLLFLGAIIIGYFLGAIPFGKIYVWYFRGKDLQSIGSGRTGGTNSLRAGGLTIGLLTSFSDVLKGIVTIIVTRWLLGGIAPADILPWLEVTAGVFSVIGHNWSIFVNFGGGAGTGPNVGWASAVFPPIFPIAFVVMAGMLYFLGWASVASMMMGLIIPIVFIIIALTGQWSELVATTPAYIVGGLITTLIVAFSLRGNFVRLFKGEERVVGLRARGKNQPENAPSS